MCFTLIAIGILVALCGIYIVIKNQNACDRRAEIIDAIYEYRLDLIRSNKRDQIEVDFEDMEPYEATLHRIFDWGYKNILPEGKYEIIKKYIVRR